jgi:hypothetical protein
MLYMFSTLMHWLLFSVILWEPEPVEHVE